MAARSTDFAAIDVSGQVDSSECTPNGGYAEKARWHAERGIPEYWVVDRTPERSDDALVYRHRLTPSGGSPAYARERTVCLSVLEAEYPRAAPSVVRPG